MKKILSFALIAVMLFTVTANVYAAGFVPRNVKGGPTLSFDGTTAKCTVAIRESGKWISVTMELWQGNTRVMTWTKANTGVVTLNETYDDVQRGQTYTLKVYGTSGGVAFTAPSKSKTA